MCKMNKREFPQHWYLEILGLTQITKYNLFMRWLYTLYFNNVVLAKLDPDGKLKDLEFSCFYTKVYLYDSQKSTRHVYLILFYIRAENESHVFWNISPTVWPFDTEHDWTKKTRQYESEILSIITDVVKYARESTAIQLFNRLKYLHRVGKRLDVWPVRFLRACNDLF